MACHRFVSHVTGFATYFGLEAVRPGQGQALGMLVVPTFFLLGAMLSGFLVDVRIRHNKKPKYYVTFGFMFLILLFVFLGGQFGFFGVFGEPLSSERDYVLLILLCMVCGIQNGTITTVSKSVIRTTHLTGITTDLGIGLARLFSPDKTNGSLKNEIHATFMRFGIIAFFCFGSLVGSFVFSRLGYFGFSIPLVTSGSLLSAMIYFQFLKKSPKVKAAKIAHGK